MGTPTPVKARRRPWLGVLCILPLVAAGTGAVTVQPAPDEPVARVQQEVGPGPQLRECAGPLTLPEGLGTGAGDEELASQGPSETMGIRTVALEPDSSLLFGRTSGATTLQDDEGNIRSPQITTSSSADDADDEGDEEIEAEVLSEDLGAAVQSVTGARTASQTDIEASQGGGPVADVVQSTVTDEGDYRSLTLNHCSSPAVQARFLGMGTTSGSSSDLVLHNASDRPATASVQIWTADGPAKMEGASRVVVAPGETEHVLLESVVADEEVLGVGVNAVGAPLGMHLQATERDGLTPGGAEILDTLPPPDTELVIPGIHGGAGTMSHAVVMNETGQDAEVELQAEAPGGEVDLGEGGTLEVPAGTVRAAPLDGVTGDVALTVDANVPVSAVARSSVVSDEELGGTIGAPVDVAISTPAPALGDADVLALPPQGPSGLLALSAQEDTTLTLIPLAPDGSAGEVIEQEVTAGQLTRISGADLVGTEDPPAGVVIVPEQPGAVHAAWLQVQQDGNGEPLMSTIPVLPNLPEAASGDIRLG